MKLLFLILAGLGVVLLYLVWAALLHDFLNGLSRKGRSPWPPVPSLPLSW